MKFSILTLAFLVATTSILKAQKAPSFSKEQQTKIKDLLGSDYVPIFSPKGELAIATPSGVSHVHTLTNGGFRKPASSMSFNILIHKGWVLASTLAAQDMKAKLGVERYNQLVAILKPSKKVKAIKKHM